MLALFEITSSGYSNIAEQFIFWNINWVEFSPDGRFLLISSSETGAVKIYNALTLELINQVERSAFQQGSENMYSYYGVSYFFNYDGSYIYTKDYNKLNFFKTDGTFVKSVNMDGMYDLKPYWSNNSGQGSVNPHEFLIIKSFEYTKYSFHIFDFIKETDTVVYKTDTLAYYVRIMGDSGIILHGDYTNNYFLNLKTKENTKVDSKVTNSNFTSNCGEKMIMNYTDWSSYYIIAYNGAKRLWEKNLQIFGSPSGVLFLDDDKNNFYIVQLVDNCVKITKMSESSESSWNLELTSNFSFRYPYLMWVRIK